MTKNQRAFRKWLFDFKTICQKHNGAPPADALRSNWTFQTRFGLLNASVHESDYESQVKRGFVQIFLRFDCDDLQTIKKAIETHYQLHPDFNHCSGKWNIALSGDRATIDRTRLIALDEFERRLNFCKHAELVKL